jgi:hypothetical protein
MNLFPRSGVKTVDVLFQVAWINLLVFIVIGILLGGDALNGYSKAGHYFLANHGKFTEVSALTFAYSFLHTCLSIVLTLAAVIAMLVFYRRKPKKAT